MKKQPIRSFDFQPGRVLAKKYEVIATLGSGWEGEVYLVREVNTGIERTAKLFFPERNVKDRSAKRYATKLHRLRHCPILIQYHSRDVLRFRGMDVSVLISEYVEGELLTEFLKRQPGRRLAPFQAVHLLHALARGMETVHTEGEYHGDLHGDNIIVQRHGLGFELKLIDMFHWTAPKKESIRDDVVDMVRVFYDALGGPRHYARQPKPVKEICRGMKRSLINERFRTAGRLRAYLERMSWD